MSVPNVAPEVDYGPDGLVPAIVQDRADGRVLMLGYMDAEALGATIEHGEVHFHSRSRDRLWRKGETSGHVLRLVSIAVDCDGDALLVTVDPVGPTCHRDTRSCFDADGAPPARDDPGFRLARDPVGHDRLPCRHASRRLVHDEPAGGRRRHGRPQGDGGGDRSAAGRQGRRHGPSHRGAIGRGPRPPWPARPATSCITRSCCSPSAAWRRRRSSRPCRARHTA